MDNSLGVMLARIDENVIQLRRDSEANSRALEAHIQKDEKREEEYLRPVYEKYQQDIGQQKSRIAGGTLIGFAINACIAAVTSWAAIKSLK